MTLRAAILALHLERRQFRRDDGGRGVQAAPHIVAARFTEEPREKRARFRLQRQPASSRSASSAALADPSGSRTGERG